MFGFLKKSPEKQLEKTYRQLLERARDIQRSGDIKGYATAMAEAEEVANKLDALRATKSK